MKNLILLLVFAMAISCSKKSDFPTNPNSIVGEEVKASSPVETDNDLIEHLQGYIEKHKLQNAQSLTVMLLINKDVQKAINDVKNIGGKIIYDPNLSHGSSIPFFIAQLPPLLFKYKSFLKNLNIKSASIEIPHKSFSKPLSQTTLSDFQKLNVPTKDINIESLRTNYRQTALGKDAIIGIIDTGVDASHLAFMDKNGKSRVVYVDDLTDETLSPITKANILDNKIIVSIDNEEKEISLPKNLANKEVFIANINEKKLTAQNGSSSNKSDYTDVNFNGEADEFIILFYKKDNQYVAIADANGDLRFSAEEIRKEIKHYNSHEDYEISPQTMIELPSRNKILRFPLLINFENNLPVSVELGIDFDHHGTHVAGIAAGKMNAFEGVAPEAKIMSAKVCSSIACSDAAIAQAIVKMFFNEKGLVPDVVNISIGSHQTYKESLTSYLIQDLAAKFGTIFFISASNNGPGFRSLNHMGSLGSVVQVGSSVSKDILQAQYNLNDTTLVNDQNLMFYSSLGPSYTGELKPNILAPGSAVSSVSHANTLNGLDHFNGTSMASPLAAGAMAAILSVLKNEENLKDIFRAKQKKISNVLSKNPTSQVSLLPFVYALRDGIQDSATKLSHLVTLQQGHGLLQANSIASISEKLLTIQDPNKTYFDLRVNENKKQTYSRNGENKEYNYFSLSLLSDGERPQDETSRIVSEKITVDIMSVEELDNFGNKTNYIPENMELFSLVNFGVNGDQVKSYQNELTLSNKVRSKFITKRNLKEMKPGHTYIATMKISQNGINVFYVTDTVHIPLRKVKQRKKEITPLKFHRYPILVGKSDSSMKVNLSLPEDTEGIIYIQAYSPSGEELEFDYIYDIPTINGSPFKETTLNINTLGKPGIYEITMTVASANWLGKTSYNLDVFFEEFGTETLALKLEPENNFMSYTGIRGNVSSAEIKNLSAARLIRDFPVASGHRSYKKIIMPKAKNWLDKEETSITISQFYDVMDIDELSNYNNIFWGRIDHNLYELKDAKMEVAYTAESASSYISIYKDIPLSTKDEDKVLYVAVDTYFAFDTKVDVANYTAAIDLLVKFNDLKPHKDKIKVGMKAHQAHSAILLKADSDSKNAEPEIKYAGLLEITGKSHEKIGIEVQIYE